MYQKKMNGSKCCIHIGFHMINCTWYLILDVMEQFSDVNNPWIYIWLLFTTLPLGNNNWTFSNKALLNCVIPPLSFFLVTIPSPLYVKWWTEFVVTHFYHMAENMHISFFKMCRSIMWSLVTVHAGLVKRQRMFGFF